MAAVGFFCVLTAARALKLWVPSSGLKNISFSGDSKKFTQDLLFCSKVKASEGCLFPTFVLVSLKKEKTEALFSYSILIVTAVPLHFHR